MGLCSTHRREYASWTSMLQRCRNPRCNRYARYGGRGITVCDAWSSFANFLSDMGSRPEGTTLDRINNDGNYEAGNCRWATHVQQAKNKSATPSKWDALTHDGLTLTHKEWAARLGVSPDTIQSRIRNQGWPVDLALSLGSCVKGRGLNLSEVVASLIHCRDALLAHQGDPVIDTALARASVALAPYFVQEETV